MTDNQYAQYAKAFDLAVMYMQMEDGYLSSLKQGASDAGIPYGDDMAAFISWAEGQMGIAA